MTATVLLVLFPCIFLLRRVFRLPQQPNPSFGRGGESQRACGGMPSPRTVQYQYHLVPSHLTGQGQGIKLAPLLHNTGTVQTNATGHRRRERSQLDDYDYRGSPVACIHLITMSRFLWGLGWMRTASGIPCARECAHFAAQNRVAGRGTDDCRTQRPFQLAWLVPGKAKASFVMSWTQPQQLGDKYQVNRLVFENYAFGEALLQIDVPAINKRQAKPNKMQGAVALTLSPIIGYDSFVTQPALQFALSPIRGQPACSGTELARHAAFVPPTGLQAPLNSSAKSWYELQVGRRLASWQRANASFQASGHWPPTLVRHRLLGPRGMTRDPTTMVGGRPKRSGPMSWPKNPQQPSPCWSINITRPCWLEAGAARGFCWLMIPARQAQPVSFPHAEKEVQGYLADDWGNLASKPRRQPRQPTYLFGR
ncbi:hypothetical protein CCM_07088 [Cordyceps militaris CM01]|uniref:Uncharacterized protein n=1 Tax=Cordyceps militaris (strain CM01) TaxID=983644 RepID=G3JLU4_CORMM|nr:uncharacterized protein CCM_07088 [Cordyceps militaris CM01]EGX90668.1 hypothetical protein CCM_07088 [Cordyceps militaris CM01]